MEAIFAEQKKCAMKARLSEGGGEQSQPVFFWFAAAFALSRLRSAFVLAMGAIAFCGGCAVQVMPPPEPLHPTVVYLCDYGFHSSLLLPMGEGKYVEYLYGDWDWTANRHRGMPDVLRALCFSSQSALGRRIVDQRPAEKMPTTIDCPRRVIPVTVSGDDCRAVEASLDARWQKHRESAINPEPGEQITYVKDDEPYSIRHDCNHLTADALQEMGCRVNGTPFWGVNFDVKKSELPEKLPVITSK